VWAARGTSARSKGVVPHNRAGWYAGLETYAKAPQPLTLATIRLYRSELRFAHDALETAHKATSLYFPFELGPKRQMRPIQGYLFKLPKFFVDTFPDLQSLAAQMAVPIASHQTVSTFGATYRQADEAASVGHRDLFSVDPALVERGLRGHARTQNELAQFIRGLGAEPRSPAPDEPNFDLAWARSGSFWGGRSKVADRCKRREATPAWPWAGLALLESHAFGRRCESSTCSRAKTNRRFVAWTLRDARCYRGLADVLERS